MCDNVCISSAATIDSLLHRLWILGAITPKMKALTSKQLQRIEKKKKKKAAYLEIAKLNDKDRKARAVMLCSRESTDSDTDGGLGRLSTPEGPSRKRHRRDEHTDSVSAHREVEDAQDVAEPAEAQHPEDVAKKKKVCGDDVARLKRELKERKTRLKYVPRFRLRDTGESASLSVAEDIRSPIFLSDIQHLLVFALLGQQSPCFPSRWCQLDRSSRLTQIVVVLLEGVSVYDFLSHESDFPTVTAMFGSRVEVITPTAYNASLVEGLVAIPIAELHRDNLVRQYGSLEAAMKSSEDEYKALRAVFPIKESPGAEQPPLPATDCFARTQLLLSVSQLLEENYPLPLKGELQHRYSHFTFTKDLYQEVTSTSPMFGLDCEMCRTTSGDLELTRVSVVNEDLQVVYESLVKPYNKITDYLTQFSGITHQLLTDVTVRLEDVQKDLKQLLPSDAILVGQSLNFDLQSLKMIHPYVIDTSIIYNVTGDRYRKTKLSVLSQRFLGEDIQVGRRGHCSVEDSSAALKLAQLKLANSIEFGDVILTGRRAAEQSRDKQLSVSAHTHTQLNCDDAKANIFNQARRAEKTAAIVCSTDVANEYSYYISEKMASLSSRSGHTSHGRRAIQCLVETCNESIVNRAGEVLLEHAFLLAHLRCPLDGASEDERHMECTRIDAWCKRLWDSTATNGLCVVLLGGKKGGANGACFLQIKKSPAPATAIVMPKA